MLHRGTQGALTLPLRQITVRDMIRPSFQWLTA